MKRLIEHIDRLMSFETKDTEFELLETEKGVPGFFNDKRQTKTKEKPVDEWISPELAVTKERLWDEFRIDINKDVIIREFIISGSLSAIAVFINGMANGSAINDFILRDCEKSKIELPESGISDYLLRNVITLCDIVKENKWSAAKSAILDGMTAVFLEGEQTVLLMDTRGYEHRAVSAAEDEKVVRGPKEGFTENLRTNITLVRRIVRTSDLVCEMRGAGGDNNIRTAILYREGVANASLVNEVKRRLARIKTRSVMGAGILEQLTERHPLSPLPQLLSTERPDRVAHFLMQGHVALLLDGSPYGNIMPTTLFVLMSSSEDSYLREPQGTILRVVRFVGAFLSVMLPAYFLSLVLYHQDLLSTEVLSTIILSRRMVFAPIASELIFLLFVFQLIREAGLRVPGSIGQAIGIIGGLILGQAAVTANLASSVVLIVVALSGLGNFCVPDYSTQIAASYFRIGFVLAAWLAGLLGVSCALLITLSWMSTLKSYGVPFLAPFTPKTYSARRMVMRGRKSMHASAPDYLNTREGESE